MHVFDVAGAIPAQPEELIAVTTAGQPPVGALSSQVVELLVTPAIPASAKAVIKCSAAAQKSGLPIAACHAKVVVPVIVPVGHVVLKLQL
jgi:hypothetical protein